MDIILACPSSLSSVVSNRRFLLPTRVSFHRRAVVNRQRRVVSLRVTMAATDAGVLLGVGRDTKPVVFTTPPKDKKLYRRVTLQNGLLAILISDPEMAHQTAGGSESGSEADTSEDEGGSEDDSEEVLISCPPVQVAHPFALKRHTVLGNAAGHAE